MSHKKHPQPLEPAQANLPPTVGATQTGPDGHTWYGNGTSWQPDPLPVPVTNRGEKLLGFIPEYEKPTSGIVDVSGKNVGTVPLGPDDFATADTADRLADLFEATVETVTTRADRVEERVLNFGDGYQAQSAGGVAARIMRNTDVSLLWLAASIGLPAELPASTKGLPAWYVGEHTGMRDVPLEDRKTALAEVSKVIAKYVIK